MISAIDTNVLLDILIPNADFADNSLKSLETADKKGDMIICELVFSELSTQFSDFAELQMFLHDTGIQLVNSNMQALYHSGLHGKAICLRKNRIINVRIAGKPYPASVILSAILLSAVMP